MLEMKHHLFLKREKIIITTVHKQINTGRETGELEKSYNTNGKTIILLSL